VTGYLVLAYVVGGAVLVAGCCAFFAPRRTADSLFWLGHRLDPQNDQGADATP
jgi:hypothetical protein